MDDACESDRYATMTAGPRSGERCLEPLLEVTESRGLHFPRARTTYGLCGPSRTELVTGLNRINHGCENQVADLYNIWRRGHKEARTWTSPTTLQYRGPVYLDLGLQAGLDETGVDRDDQPLGTTTSNFRSVKTWGSGTTFALNEVCLRSGNYYISLQASNTNHAPESTLGVWWAAKSNAVARGDSTDDDLQYTSGNLFTWLPDTIRKCWVGKDQTWGGALYTAPYDAADPLTEPLAEAFTTRWVPPGIHRYAVVIGDGLGNEGNIYDHYHTEMLKYDDQIDGANPREGDGAVGVIYAYDYDWPISSITYSAGAAHVTLTAGTSYSRLGVTVSSPLEVGDEVAINGTGTNYDGRVWVISAVTDSSHYTIAVDIDGNAIPNAGTYSGSTGMLYPRKWFAEQLWQTEILDFLTTVGDGGAHIYYCPRMPHAENDDTGTPAGTPPFEEEQRYVNTVPELDALYFGGVAGATSPANSTGLTNARRKIWRRRQEMIAGCADVMRTVIDELDSLRPDNWYGIFTSDNGWQQGAHEATEGASATWDRVGAKFCIWEESLNVPYWMVAPDEPWFTVGTSDLVVAHHDVPLTVLSWHEASDTSLIVHHAHTKRDGYSVKRLLEAHADDVILTRAIIGVGKYLQATWTGANPGVSYGGKAIIDADNMKVLQRFDDDATRARYDLNDGPEITNLDTGDATTDALQARLSALADTGRWNGSSENAYRTI